VQGDCNLETLRFQQNLGIRLSLEIMTKPEKCISRTSEIEAG